MSDPFAGQHQAIRQEYRQQAPRWGRMEIGEPLRWVVDQLPLSPQGEALDVAAGTGLVARALAPRVARVTALDLTPEMIAQGERRCAEDGIGNVRWQQGTAEAMPFPDGGFDLAITRYSFHHFVDPAAVLREMARVCRDDGLAVAIDMVSDEDPAVAARQDEIETRMDPTHTSVLSPSRLLAAARRAGLTVQGYLSRDVPMNFAQWQAQVPAEAPSRVWVRQALEAELAGGPATGMRPFRRDGALWFMHVWGVLIAGKQHRGLPPLREGSQ